MHPSDPIELPETITCRGSDVGAMVSVYWYPVEGATSGYHGYRRVRATCRQTPNQDDQFSVNCF